MYGWLVLNDDGSLSVNFLRWRVRMDPATVPDETVQARSQLMLRVLHDKLTPSSTDHLDDARKWLMGTVKYYVCDDDAVFGAHLAVQFFTQHANDYPQVLAALQQQVDREFGPELTAKVNWIAFDVVTALKAVVFLIHEEYRPPIINEECARLRTSTLPVKGGFEMVGHGFERWAVAMKKHHEITTGLSIEVRGAVWEIGWIAIATSPHVELETTRKHIDGLLEAQRYEVFTTIYKSYAGSVRALPEYRLNAFARLALAMANEQPNAEPTATVSEALTKVYSDRNDSQFKRIRATFDAVEAGRLDLGPRMTGSRQAQAQSKEAAARQDKKQLMKCVSALHQLADEPAPGSPGADEIASWSVTQLAEWIEGPPTGPHRVKLEPRRIASSAADRPAQPRSKPSTAQSPPDRAKEAELLGFELTESIVSDVARIGLCTAARYMQDEIACAIGQAKRLGADAKALQDCAVAAAKVQALIAQLEQQTGPFDADPVQSELSEAEADLERLRATIRAARFDAQRRSRFDDALRLALSREPLEPGRRTGGRIECPLAPTDLDWVYESYHRRVLTHLLYVMDRGRPVRLTPDTVLTLYVTQSSQTTGIVFDISVHLCKRIAGSTASACLPGAPTDPYPPLNRGDWYDPWITCGVLHVPEVQPRRQGAATAKK